MAGVLSIFFRRLPSLSFSSALLPAEVTKITPLSNNYLMSSRLCRSEVASLFRSMETGDPDDKVTTLFFWRFLASMSCAIRSYTSQASLRVLSLILTAIACFAVPYFWPVALEAVAVLWEASFPVPSSRSSRYSVALDRAVCKNSTFGNSSFSYILLASSRELEY